MASNINSITLIARVVDKRRDDGSSMWGATYLENHDCWVIEGRVAVTHGWGEREWTSFFDVSWFASPDQVDWQLSEIVPGARLGIQGELRQDRWETSDGDPRSKVVIRADLVEFLGFKAKDDDMVDLDEDEEPRPAKVRAPRSRAKATTKAKATKAAKGTKAKRSRLADECPEI